ncbi:unnamed protein product [Amaranthus hypochondriacus]
MISQFWTILVFKYSRVYNYPILNKNQTLLHVQPIQTLHLPRKSFYRCCFRRSFNIPTAEQYDDRSVYQKNLNLLLSNLSAEASTKKYSNSTVGEGVDTVYGLFLCNGAYTTRLCQDCIKLAVQQVLQKCPYEYPVDAMIIYGQCLLRYANRSMYSILDDTVYFTYDFGPRFFKQFDEQLSSMLIDLSDKAIISDDTSLAFAMELVYVSVNITLTAYVDCTPDLAPSDCNKCLQIGLTRLPMNGKQIGTIVQPSCRLSYVFIDFNPGKSSFIPYIALSVVSTISGLLFILSFMYFRKGKLQGKPSGLEEMETMENLHLQFSAIKVATDNFSPANKIGRGGFGVVYVIQIGEYT